MALTMKDHSTANIMIRWSSDEFLVYIRPQVLEWANSMSRGMVSFDSFLDVGLFDRAAPTDPRTRQHVHQLNGHGAIVPMEAFNMMDTRGIRFRGIGFLGIQYTIHRVGLG
jgi:hypothetical protein